MPVDWKYSDAKDALLDAIANGDISHTMSARQAWDYYQYEDAFEGVEFNQFSRNLTSYRKKMMADPKFVLDQTPAAAAMIKEQFDNGTLPVDQDEMSAEEAWDEFFRGKKEFNNVPFWHFEEKLRKIRQEAKAYQLKIEEINFKKQMTNYAEKLKKKQGMSGSVHYHDEWNGWNY